MFQRDVRLKPVMFSFTQSFWSGPMQMLWMSPKPWRCEYHDAPSAWPFADQAAQVRHEQWEIGYLERCQSHATCEIVQAGGDVNHELQELVQIHDTATRVGSELPLA